MRMIRNLQNIMQQTEQYKIGDESVQLLKLALPIIIASLSHVALGFTDIIMLGRYNELDFAAGSLGANLTLLMNLISVGLLMGISPLVAHAVGAETYADVRLMFQQGVWLALITGIFVSIGTYHSGIVLNWLNVAEDLQSATNSYLHIIAFSLPFTTLYLVPRYVSEAVEHSTPMMLVQMLMIPTNVILNYCLIYGHFGFPELGVKGAAIASLITHVFGCFAIWAYLLKGKIYRQYFLFNTFEKPKKAEISKIFILGLPIAFTLLFEAGLFTATSVLMSKFGEVAVTSHQIAINYASLMFMVPLGLAMAVTVKVGNALGRGELNHAIFRAGIGIMMAVVFMLVSAIIIFIFHDQIAKIYTSYAQIIELAALLLILAGVFQLVDGLQVVVAGVLRGMKDTRVPMVMTFISYWMIGLTSSIYFGFFTGLREKGLWVGLILGLSVAAVLLSWRMRVMFARQRNNR